MISRKPQLSLFKVNTGWLRAVEGATLLPAFADAWSSIINALEGTWGNTSFKSFNSETVIYDVIKGRFEGSLDTTYEGPATITLPYTITGVGRVKIDEVLGGIIIASTTYIIEEGDQSVNVTLTPGRKLITISGKARRI
jgi:hypothetical protein